MLELKEDKALSPCPAARALKEIYDPISAELLKVEACLAGELSAHSPKIQTLIDHVSSFRGKRMRPALALLAGQCSGNLSEGHIFLGAIVELIHTATLIHDDILDEADIRRGLPTVCSKWGTDVSVLLGDYLFSRAFSVLARFDGQYCLLPLTQTTNMMCEGELLQLRSKFDFNLSEEHYVRIAELKTASLCAVSTQLGARLAGAPDSSVDSFYRFGWKLGLAFQITDDCLDIMGEEKVVGKSLGTDLLQGKLTLPAIRLLKLLPEHEREGVAQIIKDGFPLEHREQFQDLVASYGTVESSLAAARGYLREGVEALAGIPDCPARGSLLSLCDYILGRKL